MSGYFHIELEVVPRYCLHAHIHFPVITAVLYMTSNISETYAKRLLSGY